MHDKSKNPQMSASAMIQRAAQASRRMTIEERWALIVASQESSRDEESCRPSTADPEKESNKAQ